MEIKYVVTTRKEVLETLKADRWYIVGIDGTVPDAQSLYDALYDHHRVGGAEIQIYELTSTPLQEPAVPSDKLAITTTQVDADAICASYFYLKGKNLSAKTVDFLCAISYDCDHLVVPPTYKEYATEAAMVVASLKEESNKLVSELKLPLDRKKWSIEDKEAFGSKAFEQGIQLIDKICKGEWDYKEKAKPYWERVEANTQMILDQDRIYEYKGAVIFNAQGLGGQYIDPRCWYRALSKKNPEFKGFLALTQREVYQDNLFKGYSYTLAKIPLSDSCVDFTQGLFELLSQEEKKKNPEADNWGGRATVGGSGWNKPSNLTPEEVIDTVNNWLSKS